METSSGGYGDTLDRVDVIDVFFDKAVIDDFFDEAVIDDFFDEAELNRYLVSSSGLVVLLFVALSFGLLWFVVLFLLLSPPSGIIPLGSDRLRL